jgi:serine/threonine protein kinase
MPNATVPCQVSYNRSRTNPPYLATIPHADSGRLGNHQYRTGKTLGSGTYAIVKEAIHIKTGKYYACKVINKKLMEGREHMVGLVTRRFVSMVDNMIQVRNEIAVLKRVSSGNPNIVTLHDYFEVSHTDYSLIVYR